jgi:dolichol-phosphate mannosyltransferase
MAVDAILPRISKLEAEVLVVDDTSPDGTAEVVKRISKKLTYVSLLSNPKKSGLGGAYLKGMAHAFDKMHADVIFEFDADLSHDPRKIPEFLLKIDQGYDLVLGSRYIEGGGIPDDWGAHRKFLSVMGISTIRLILTNFRIHDWTTGYRAIENRYEAVNLR